MTILENRQELLEDFIRLNEEWISHYFEIEEVDRELASDPMKVITNGGYIFSLVDDGVVKGVCALFNNGNGIFELARMAVSPNSQGKGYGKKLIEYALAKLTAIDAQQVYLVSNTKLTTAIGLYKKYGFKTTSQGQHPVYTRANIVMCRDCK
ncbi:GNAT family N-acetyltransferase [Psychrosphaera aestuarii]|uniref:GNAT family N-acetyltransferase n=1 Tax=Psychrosphaera aestuarii TaxID=1266052 RepID=UPI001FD53E9D|nr:GNAT family N-acetyltransferase [Psychrosphaera aestuarii]